MWSKIGRTSAYLTPSRSTEANCKHWKKPSVRFTEVRQDSKHDSPEADEECDDEQDDLPLRDSATP